MILNRNQLWALSSFGKEKFQDLIILGLEEDLAFEVLNRLYSDTQIYDVEIEELDSERLDGTSK